MSRSTNGAGIGEETARRTFYNDGVVIPGARAIAAMLKMDLPETYREPWEGVETGLGKNLRKNAAEGV